MKHKTLIGFTIFGIVWCILLGCLGHFFYEWSGYNKIIGLFFSTGESSWQHMKLLFFPFMVYGILTFIFLRNRYRAVFIGSAINMVIGLFFIPVAYHCYRLIIGHDIMWLNIAIFVMSTMISCIGTAYYAILHERDYDTDTVNCMDDIWAMIVHVVVALAFILTGLSALPM